MWFMSMGENWKDSEEQRIKKKKYRDDFKKYCKTKKSLYSLGKEKRCSFTRMLSSVSALL